MTRLRLINRLAMAACSLAGGTLLGTEIAYFHDPSGNLTNGSLQSTSLPATFVVAGNRTIGIGDALSISVVGQGAGTCTYQWRLNGTNIAGATNSTFYLAAVGSGDAGVYSVVVSNASGAVTNEAGITTVLATAKTLYGIAYGAGRFVAVGETGTVVSSPDLVTWTVSTSGTTNQLEAIAFGNETFVVVGARGTVLTSSNGADWVVRSSENTNHLKGVAFGNNQFVAVGSGGTTLTSASGIAWALQTYDYPRLEAITFANDRFVAVGTGGTIWTSFNSTNWFDRSYGTAATLNAAAYGNGKYVVVGTGGIILMSTNGTNFTAQTSGTIKSLESVLFFSNTFYALGPEGQNLASSDGVSWKATTSGTFDPLYGSTVGNNTPVAVGRRGMILPLPTFVLDHFEWAPITSPQRVNQPFGVTIRARDAANNLVSSYNGTATVSVVSLSTGITNCILSGTNHSGSAAGTNTVGYSFTPNKDIWVTQFRHYSGKRVSVWRDNGELLARMSVTSTPGTWTTTALPTPFLLLAGHSYVVAAYTDTERYYRDSGSRGFADGTINQSFIGPGDTFPTYSAGVFWYFVDIGYAVRPPGTNTVAPTVATFTNGTAVLDVSLGVPGEHTVLSASETAGHSGQSAPFCVYATNDLAITLAASPSPAAAQSSLTYAITALNAGPNSSAGVYVTNLLPQGVAFVSATPSQGTCQFTNGKVVCSLGTLASQAASTVSIVVTPTNAGVMLTNAASVSRSEAEVNLANNVVTISTYVPPILTPYSVGIVEGNVGTSSAQFQLGLSSPSILTIRFDAHTINETATAGSDYVSVNGNLSIVPGLAAATFNVAIQGDTAIEANESFLLYLSNLTNATLLQYNVARCTITNDDGGDYQVHTFAWNTIYTPKRTNEPFTATITARDASNRTATAFNSSVTIRAVQIGGAVTNTMLTNDLHIAEENLGLFTLGYEFIPTTNMFITHVRHYFGSKVSLWRSGGFLLASKSVESVPGEWRETELTTPVFLTAGSSYRVGVYSGGEPYCWNTEASRQFVHGELEQSYYAFGDAFPSSENSVRWYMVDLRYALPAAVQPTATGSFTNGVLSGAITMPEVGTNFRLMADDSDGHIGFGNRFHVYQADDLAVFTTMTPAVPLVSSNLEYGINVVNSGPNPATGVFVTNTLPADATFVSATTTQGSCSMTNGIVTCNIGTITNLWFATVTITVTPTVAGQEITNAAIAVRNEPDPDSSNNEVVSVVIPSMALSLLLQQAADFAGASWRSGAQELWSSQTNTTHDGVGAAQSGPVIHGQASWIETTVRGPGTLQFWWKVSSEAGGDGLIFYTNGVAQTSISGDVDWQQKSYSILPGPCRLRWSYVKDANISSGADAGWLDQVSYTVPTFYFGAPTCTNDVFVAKLYGAPGQRLIWQRSSDVRRWTSFATNTLLTNYVTLTNAAPTSTGYRFYRAMHSNE